MKRLLGVSLLCAMLASPPEIAAQQFVDLGDFVVHYNALSTDHIPPQIAQAYSIRRSSNLAMLNVTVLRKEADGTETPMQAKVEANAVNLTGQRRTLEMREIPDAGGAVYYIGILSVYNLETIKFTVNLDIEGLEEPAFIEFRKQFYTE